MTEGAQQALRRTMEIYSNTTRFALACNYSEKVIEAIQSRCAILRYSRLSDAQILARTIQICQKENVSLIYPVKIFPIWRNNCNNLGTLHRGWFGSCNLHCSR